MTIDFLFIIFASDLKLIVMETDVSKLEKKIAELEELSNNEIVQRNGSIESMVYSEIEKLQDKLNRIKTAGCRESLVGKYFKIFGHTNSDEFDCVYVREVRNPNLMVCDRVHFYRWNSEPEVHIYGNQALAFDAGDLTEMPGDEFMGMFEKAYAIMKENGFGKPSNF